MINRLLILATVSLLYLLALGVANANYYEAWSSIGWNSVDHIAKLGDECLDPTHYPITFFGRSAFSNGQYLDLKTLFEQCKQANQISEISYLTIKNYSERSHICFNGSFLGFYAVSVYEVGKIVAYSKDDIKCEPVAN